VARLLAAAQTQGAEPSPEQHAAWLAQQEMQMLQWQQQQLAWAQALGGDGNGSTGAWGGGGAGCCSWSSGAARAAAAKLELEEKKKEKEEAIARAAAAKLALEEPLQREKKEEHQQPHAHDLAQILKSALFYTFSQVLLFTNSQKCSFPQILKSTLSLSCALFLARTHAHGCFCSSSSKLHCLSKYNSSNSSKSYCFSRYALNDHQLN
jgi:hypothetical protein